MDDAGGIKSWYDYYPYGLIQRASIAGSDARFKFTGKEFDSEDDFDMYYFGARFYDPEIAGWLVTDPVSQYHSPYSYVGGNPVNYVDPNGAYATGGLGLGFPGSGGGWNVLPPSSGGSGGWNIPFSISGTPNGFSIGFAGGPSVTDIGGTGLPGSGISGAWADRVILDPNTGEIIRILKFNWWNPWTYKYRGDQFAWEGYESFVFNEPVVSPEGKSFSIGLDVNITYGTNAGRGNPFFGVGLNAQFFGFGDSRNGIYRYETTDLNGVDIGVAFSVVVGHGKGEWTGDSNSTIVGFGTLPVSPVVSGFSGGDWIGGTAGVSFGSPVTSTIQTNHYQRWTSESNPFKNF